MTLLRCLMLQPGTAVSPTVMAFLPRQTVNQNQPSLPSVASVRFVTVTGEVANVEPFKPHTATYLAEEQFKRLRTDHTRRAMPSEME